MGKTPEKGSKRKEKGLKAAGQGTKNQEVVPVPFQNHE